MVNSSVSFSDILTRLADIEQPFPARYLHFFSDLFPDQVELLKRQWQDLPDQRKLAFLEDLEDFGEHDTLMDFTAAGSIALDDPDDQIREVALHLFWDTEDKAFISKGLSLLEKDPSSAVRSSAASILGRFVYMGETDELSPEMSDRIVDQLLLAYNDDPAKLVRRRALESLGYSSRDEIHRLIILAESSKDNEWLASSLYAMGRSADSDWSRSIKKHLTHSDAAVREEAVRAAGELELKEMRGVLLGILEDESDEDVRTAAIWSLSQIGGEGIREAFTELMETADDDEFIEFMENALDNLNFTDELAKFDLLDINGEDPEDWQAD
jgi:HEAT repeat protein